VEGLTRKASLLLAVQSLLLGVCTGAPAPKKANLSEAVSPRHAFFAGDYSKQSVIGQSLPGTWRPFSDDSPWNTPIDPSAKAHPDSEKIMAFIGSVTKSLHVARIYNIPVWVVNSKNIPSVKMQSERIFDTWDRNQDGWSDIGVPVAAEMWGEPTADGHISIIDPFTMTAWEFSKFQNAVGGKGPTCTTFNVWDLRGSGVADSNGHRWQTRGGRGSGFPEIAGLLRPEELKENEIQHALVFTFSKNRRSDDDRRIFIPPAARSDGKHIGSQYPVEGMRFQLNPALSDRDFDRWGLNREGKIVARALQKYGMFNGDNGGNMKLQVQLLAPSEEANVQAWEKLFPGFMDNIEKIPVDQFRVVYTAEPIIK
jgi:hypothetical protein